MGPATGAFDYGPNSIDNNVFTAVKILDELLVEHLFSYFFPTLTQYRIAKILIKGHSRGAVAAALFAKMTTIHRIALGIKQEVVLFDPVPGPGEDKYKTNIDVREIGKTAYFLPIKSGWSVFQPCHLYNMDRLIISFRDHGAGKQDLFLYEKKFYKGNRLNDLPQGIYRETSEKHPTLNYWILEKIDSQQKIEELLSQVDEALKKLPYTIDVKKLLSASFTGAVMFFSRNINHHPQQIATDLSEFVVKGDYYEQRFSYIYRLLTANYWNLP